MINHAPIILKVGGVRSDAFEDFCCLNLNTTKLLAKSYFQSSINVLLSIHYLGLHIKLMSKVIFSIQYPHQLFRINISLSQVRYYQLNQYYKIHQLWHNASKLKIDFDHLKDFFQRKRDEISYQLLCNLLKLQFHFSNIYHQVCILF